MSTDWPAGYGRIIRDSVRSTLDEALLLAPETPGAFWVLAHHQTSARGRRGRPWSMPKGNFAATLLLRPDEPPGVAALRSFVMSLALFRTLADVTAMPENFAMKWPNDVLLEGGKLAGILLESTGQRGRIGPLAIGVGVNLRAAPSAHEVEEGALTPVSLMDRTGITITPEAFLDILAAHYAGLETQFTQYGFAPIRTAWLAHAARLGTKITARTGRAEMTGIFEDVDTDGNLMLREAAGLRRIAAADVFFTP
ncbi:Bifunctional ligase/repressor BirA [Roseobacter fucihabitans]|uniref:biotin--[biotin carboxyl-carrier protein] ligase n=1 Tax=Roseobacter fucihabitans TaxID=1537242 RepID=A0ABZ2BQB1_9RHOB|nr:biotin--[acetyl-CoA-carboxylase] ligase [Roseobacter litoralis]MBC6964222.1 Bifunctional ligase/repressor BirA [Roseobacter litoralis]